MSRLLKIVEHVRKPVLVSLRLFEERDRHPFGALPAVDPEAWIRLAKDHGGISLVFSGLAAPEANMILSAAQSNTHSFICLGFPEEEGWLEEWVERGRADRILYGSNYPFFYVEAATTKLDASRVPQAVRNAVGSANARRLFGCD